MEQTMASNNEQLYEAALNGNENRVAEILNKNEEINLSYKSFMTDRTALAAAVKEGYCRIVSLLLKWGADPKEEVNVDGRMIPLLQIAASAKHPAIVKLLLRAGATVHSDSHVSIQGLYQVCLKMDNKSAHLLSAVDSTNLLLKQLKNYSYLSFGCAEVVKNIAVKREKYQSEYFQLYKRIKELQDEISDIPELINIANRRVSLERQLHTAMHVTLAHKNYTTIAKLGVDILNLEKTTAKYCLLEEDCATLSSKYHTLLADITSAYQPLEDARLFEYLQDFTALHTALKALNIATLEATLRNGLLRPATQLTRPVQQGDRKVAIKTEEDGSDIKRKRTS